MFQQPEQTKGYWGGKSVLIKSVLMLLFPFFLYFLEDSILASQKLTPIMKNLAATLGKNELWDILPNISHLLNVFIPTGEEDSCYLWTLFCERLQTGKGLELFLCLKLPQLFQAKKQPGLTNQSDLRVR